MGGYDPQTLQERLARYQLTPGRPPRPVVQFANGVTGESQQMEDREHARQVLFAVTEVVFEVVALGLQDIERFVVDLPCVRPSPGKGYGM